MGSPIVSIIIPGYNNAEYLGETIQSCLDQSYPNFEIMLVNDASPDHIEDVVKEFDDPRIKYIVHDENKGLSAARNTGIRASTGELIALLDGDDLFHPDKLKLHVEYLNAHPEIGSTYNARFELNHSSNTIREIWRPPLSVSLEDLVVGYPFSPSDMIIRRDWIFRIGLFDEKHTWVGEDMDINCRLALAGCNFAGIDRALNYRRYHSGRVYKNLRMCLEDTLVPLERTFSDPACPPDVIKLKEIAPSIHYMLWGILAFNQNDTVIGQEYCNMALRLNPTLLDGSPSQFLASILSWSVIDESVDHEELINRVFSQLPAEFSSQYKDRDWAIAHGYLVRGTRATIWDRPSDGTRHFERAHELGARFDQPSLESLAVQLVGYEIEMGHEKTGEVIRELLPYLYRLGDNSLVRKFISVFYINRAFLNYRSGHSEKVPGLILKSLTTDPQSTITNRGALAILIRSMVGIPA